MQAAASKKSAVYASYRLRTEASYHARCAAATPRRYSARNSLVCYTLTTSAGAGIRTQMGLLPGDFKSPASASFATPAAEKGGQPT